MSSLPRDQVDDTSTLGASVWILLFGCVMVVSLLANVLLVIFVGMNKKKQNVVYAIHIIMFAINLMDYGWLLFDFSLGIGHEYPYDDVTCKLYQMGSKASPVLQGWLVVSLVIVSVRRFGSNNNNNRGGGSVTTTCSRTNDLVLLTGITTILVSCVILVSIPTAYFSSIITNIHDKSFCVVELSTISKTWQQEVTSIYYLVYSSILPFWLPLMVSIGPLRRLSKDQTRCDKQSEICISLSTALSFFIFYIFHGTLVFVRHTLDIAGVPLSPYNNWMMKVGQSLLWLVAYFWHFARPALVISLDPHFKQKLHCLTSPNCQSLQEEPESDSKPVEMALLCNTKETLKSPQNCEETLHLFTPQSGNVTTELA